jgi:hypothetical protein
MVHGSLLKRSVRYEIGYFRGDGDSPPALESMPFPLPEDEAPVKQPSQAARIRVAPFRALSRDTLVESLEFGVAATSTTTPVGPNHLQGQSVLGVDFFPRRYYVSGPRRRMGAEFSWTPGPASVKSEYIRSTEARLGQGVGSEAGLDNDLPDLVGRGWYVMGTWVLTGEALGRSRLRAATRGCDSPALIKRRHRRRARARRRSRRTRTLLSPSASTGTQTDGSRCR